MPDYPVVEPRLRCVLPFEAVPAEVRQLRRTAVVQLSQWGTPVAADEAQLLVTELATNVVKHVGERASATLVLEWCGERLRIEVHDKSQAMPAPSPQGSDAECGRGLQLVAALAVDWGAVLTAAGKAVWCEIQTGGGRACRRIERAAEALERYAGLGSDPSSGWRAAGLEEAAVELIADLLHWTSSRGHDPDDFLDRAQMHYEAEADAA